MRLSFELTIFSMGLRPRLSAVAAMRLWSGDGIASPGLKEPGAIASLS